MSYRANQPLRRLIRGPLSYQLKAIQENKGWYHHLAFCLLGRSTLISEYPGSAETSGTTQLCVSVSPCLSLPTWPPSNCHSPPSPQKTCMWFCLECYRVDLRLYFKNLTLVDECRRNRKKEHTNKGAPERIDSISPLITTFYLGSLPWSWKRHREVAILVIILQTSWEIT